MSEVFTFALILAAIRSATPLIFAALGGLFSERSGVINIALEGLMLAGAFTAAVVTYESGSPYIGFLVGMALDLPTGPAVVCSLAVAGIIGFCFGANSCGREPDSLR